MNFTFSDKYYKEYSTEMVSFDICEHLHILHSSNGAKLIHHLHQAVGNHYSNSYND